MRKVCLKALSLALAFTAVVGGAFRLEGQTIQTLIQFTNTWTFDESGRELGTAWRTTGYTPDSQWETGPGLIGYDADFPNPYRFQAPISTVVFISDPIFPTNYYFRTTFTFSGSTVGLSLVASNLIDDGAVIFLNGTEIGRFRVPTGQNAATFASAGPTTEGVIDTLVITNLSALRQGLNLLAAEVHQGTINSSDVMWGCKLVAIRAEPLVITTNLVPQIVAYLGDPLTLEVGIDGGPAAYRWFKVGTSTPVSTSPTFRVNPVVATTGGEYFVVVTNLISAVTSVVTRVVVLPDAKGPEPIEAVGRTNSAVSQFRGAPTIDIAFNESLQSGSTVTTNVKNYFVYAGTNFANPVLVTNVTTSFTDKPRVHLWVSGANWLIGSNYFVLIRGGVPDARGTNYIDPYTMIGVSWEIKTNIMQMSDAWSFYSGSFFLDPTFPAVYGDFFETNYVVDYNAGWGGPSAGIFYQGQADPSVVVCAGDIVNTTLGIQTFPACFRRTLVLPTNFVSGGSRVIVTTNRFVADDGLVLYINGQEIYRWNVAGTAPVDQNTLALADQVNPPCQTAVLSLTNVFRPGTNVIAAAVVQSAANTGTDVAFGFKTDATFFRTSPLPPGTPPAERSTWTYSQTSSNLVLSWATNLYGSKLEYTTNLGPTALWIQVKDQWDPYTNNVGGATAGPRRFYRLVR